MTFNFPLKFTRRAFFATLAFLLSRVVALWLKWGMGVLCIWYPSFCLYVCLSVWDGLSVCLSVWKKLKLSHTICYIRDRDFISRMHNLLENFFQMALRLMTLWPWLWHLTYISKTFTFVITCEPLQVGISYFSCTFLLSVYTKFLTLLPWLIWILNILSFAISFELLVKA